MIGKKLKELIRLRNIKQVNLAKYVGISPSRLSNYLSDKREPDLEMLAKMAKYLGTDLNYFTEIKFKKDVTYNSQPAQMHAAETLETFTAVNDDVVYIPSLSINSKKRASKNHFTPVSKKFLEGVTKPEENAIFFEVTTGIGGDTFTHGDFILAAKFESVSVKSGTTIFERGRNGKCFKYIEDKNTRMLLSDDAELIFLDKNADYESYYAVLWIFKNVE